jgi:RNA polymerase sigma-70 factor (ECF subfamily)
MNTTMQPKQPQLGDALVTTLVANLSAFQAFARRRLRDDQLAADVVQESLLRALRAAPGLTSEKNLLAWFYRILRNVLTDLYRKNHREAEKLAEFQAEFDGPDPELESTACACVRGLLGSLRPDYAAAVQAVDLNGEGSAEAAEALGVSRNLLKARLHRARRQLRERLEQLCQACATHGCLDCTCEPSTPAH